MDKEFGGNCVSPGESFQDELQQYVKYAGPLPTLCHGCSQHADSKPYCGCSFRNIRGIPVDIFNPTCLDEAKELMPEGMITTMSPYEIMIKPNYENEYQKEITQGHYGYIFHVEYIPYQRWLTLEFISRIQDHYHPHLEIKPLMYWAHSYFVQCHGAENIQGLYSYWPNSSFNGDNYRVFEQNKKQGMSITEAALNTFTGKIASSLGYTKVSVGDNTKIGNAYHVGFRPPEYAEI